MRNLEFRKTNSILDARPRVWVFPVEIFWSFVIITIFDLIVFYEICQLDLVWVLLITAWICGTWWLILGNRPYKFLSKFRRIPRWTRGHVRQQPFGESEFAMTRTQRIRHQPPKTRNRKSR